LAPIRRSSRYLGSQHVKQRFFGYFRDRPLDQSYGKGVAGGVQADLPEHLEEGIENRDALFRVAHPLQNRRHPQAGLIPLLGQFRFALVDREGDGTDDRFGDHLTLDEIVPKGLTCREKQGGEHEQPDAKAPAHRRNGPCVLRLDVQATLPLAHEEGSFPVQRLLGTANTES